MPGQIRLTEEQIEKMKRLQSEGATTRDLVERFSCSETTVRLYCPPTRVCAMPPRDAARPSTKDIVLEGSYHWGHRHRGGKRTAIKARICKCTEKIGGAGCGGTEYVPTSRSQRYRPECYRLIWEQQHGRAWPEQRTRTNAIRNAEARSPRTDAVKVDKKRWDPTRPKQYVCQTCYGLPHAEERNSALARFIDGARKVSLVGCPECGGAPGTEKIERKSAIVSNAALALNV